MPILSPTTLVKDKSIINSSRCKKAIAVADKLIKGQGRMLVRKSGTEPKIKFNWLLATKILPVVNLSSAKAHLALLCRPFTTNVTSSVGFALFSAFVACFESNSNSFLENKVLKIINNI